MPAVSGDSTVSTAEATAKPCTPPAPAATGAQPSAGPRATRAGVRRAPAHRAANRLTFAVRSDARVTHGHEKRPPCGSLFAGGRTRT